MSQRVTFRTIDKYAVFYGPGNLDRLLRYDAVVVEPGHRTSDDVDALHKNGTLVIAYVSVMEVHDEHPLKNSVEYSDLLRYDTPPYEYVIQPGYNNQLTDLCSSHWRGLLLRHVGELLTRQGYDGVFLDTIGDVEMTDIPRQMQQVEAAASLVEQLRKWFPDAILIQNNGLELLCLQTARYLDAITWENPPIDVVESKTWINAVAERLVKLRLSYNLRILVLFEGTRQERRADFIRARSFSDEYGFKVYFSPIHYQSFQN